MPSPITLQNGQLAVAGESGNADFSVANGMASNGYGEHVRNAIVRIAAPSATVGVIPPTVTTTAGAKTVPVTARTTAVTAASRGGARVHGARISPHP